VSAEENIMEKIVNALTALLLADPISPLEVDVLTACDPAVVTIVADNLAEAAVCGSHEGAAFILAHLIAECGYEVRPAAPDSVEPPEEHDTDVVLHEVGPDKAAVIEALRALPEMEHEVRTPEVFVADCRDGVWPALNVPRERAEGIKAQLERAGATVDLEEND
jgi:ribosomal protein L7/L12